VKHNEKFIMTPV